MKEGEAAAKPIFGVVAGQRLHGKTTLAGTLPGRTLLLQARVLESGSESAKALAKRNGFQLDVANFSSVEELLSVMTELKTDTTYDNIYVDGLSALTELKMLEGRMVILAKNDAWEAYRELAAAVRKTLLAAKELSYPDKAKKAKHTWVTCALAVKLDKGGTIIDVELEAKGRVAVTEITKLAEVVVTIRPPETDEQGKTRGHRLLTQSDGVWPARIDGILAGDTAGFIEPADLGKLIALRNGDKANGK